MIKKYDAYSGCNTTIECIAKEQADGAWIKISDVKAAFGLFDKEDMAAAQKDWESGGTSANSRYESAMAVYVEYCEAAAPEFKETFDNWLRERLHSAKAPNVS